MSDDKEICGVVMPISAIDGCDESHWSEVLGILTDAIESVGYDANLVSNADDVGIIHKRIIQNLYVNPIVVCDISGKNPNVMFELGMRLAFDKPTIIVKDDETSYSFDTSAIEHIEYPRDLRFSKIVEFKNKLSSKIEGTIEKFRSDPENSTFLKHFGEFKVAKIDRKEVSGQEYIIEELKSLRADVRSMEYRNDNRYFNSRDRREGDINICLKRYSSERSNEMLKKAALHEDVKEVKVVEISPNHSHLVVNLVEGANAKEIRNELRPIPDKALSLAKERKVNES